MTRRKPEPGVSRDARYSDVGLQRLERQLQAGAVSQVVLRQWVRRYGDAAQALIDQYALSRKSD